MTMLTGEATRLAYIFKGRLCGLLCPDFMEPLSNVKVRLYRLENENEVTVRAVASPKDTLRILKDEEVQAKERFLLAETETDEDGNFVFALGEKEGYGGEAFDVDVYCGTVPHLKVGPRPPHGPVQFSITTVQPMYRQTEQAQIAAWDYCLPHRFWCAIRALFGAWTICGHVMVCDSGAPVSGVKVTAFDADWTQDDALGSGISDASGHYRIDYLASDFKVTPFSWLQIELIGGPDLYFRVEDGMGNILLNEPRSQGRTPGRENAGPCMEVNLCVDKQPQTPPHTDTIPLFNQIGMYHIYTDLTADGLTISGNFAFTGVIPLMGIMPDGTNSEALEYRFAYQEYLPDGTLPAGSNPVTPAMIPATQIGWLEFRDWDGTAWTTNSAPYYVNNPAVAPTIIHNSDGTTQSHICNVNADPNGWIAIPRENDLSFGGVGRFVPNGNLIYLNTAELTDEIYNVTGLLAGNSVPSGQQASEHKFKLFFEARKVIGHVGVSSNALNAIQMSNTSFAQHRHPDWGVSDITAPVVVELDIQELMGGGCGQIGGSMHALYTVYHPYLGTVGWNFEGNLPPSPPATVSLDLTPALGTHEVASGSAGQVIDLSTFDSCAYILWLNVTLRLTSGYGQVYGTFQDHIAFCKD